MGEERGGERREGTCMNRQNGWEEGRKPFGQRNGCVGISECMEMEAIRYCEMK